MALPTSELFNRYYFSEVLGEGQSGRIWRCRDRITGETLACKQVRKRGMSHVELADLRREVQAMLILRGHPNVLCLRGLYEDDKAVYMITELCAGGDLFALIAEHEGLEESAAARLFLQLARAVRWCHINRVVHRDIKPENILVVPPELSPDSAPFPPKHNRRKSRLSDNESSSPPSSPESPAFSASPDGVETQAAGRNAPRPEDMGIRLADFGLAFPLQPGSAIIGAAGSAPYEAPEVLAHEPYNYCADIWSLGVLLYAMLSANWPAFPDDNRKLLPSDLQPKPWPSISFEAKDLIRRMLTVDPMDRIDIIGVLEHPWLAKQLAPPRLEAPSPAPSLAPSPAPAQSQRPKTKLRSATPQSETMKRWEPSSNAVAVPRALSVAVATAAATESPKSEPVSPTTSVSPGGPATVCRENGQTLKLESPHDRPQSVAVKLAEVPRSHSNVLPKSARDVQATVATTPGRSRQTRRSRLQRHSSQIAQSHLSSTLGGDHVTEAGRFEGCGVSNSAARHFTQSALVGDIARESDGNCNGADGDDGVDGESKTSNDQGESEGDFPSPSSPPSRTSDEVPNAAEPPTSSGRGWCEAFEHQEKEREGVDSSILSCRIMPGRRSRFKNHLEDPPLPAALSLSSCSSVSSGSDL
ncbi:hypothetical protein CLOM_g8270 [Closterium sp. NIES-68]|nr:hypothetical protein CLOM_g8270 [Closterium sp. NIES-68]